MDNPKISIIVPVYNVEKYIDNCINSILNQRFKNFELLLIDDGSTDKSGEICDIYSQNDTRIKVFHQVNKGPSATRNLGISLSKGEYIGFVDSDDTINKEMYEEMYNLAIDNNYDMVACGYKEVNYENESEYEFIRPLNGYYELVGDNIKIVLESLLCKNQILGYPSLCNKLYRKDIIIKNNISIKENIKIAEDLCFNIQILDKANKIGSVNKVLYEYRRININSIMNSKNNLYLKFEACKEMLNVLEKSHISREVYLKCLKYENSSIITSYVGLIKSSVLSNKNLYQNHRFIKNLVVEEYLINAMKDFDKSYLTFKVLIIVYIIKFYLRLNKVIEFN